MCAIFLSAIFLSKLFDPWKFHADSGRRLQGKCANSTKFDQKNIFHPTTLTKCQILVTPARLFTFGYWHLGFVWDLGFGIWDFAHWTLSGCCMLAVHTGHSFH